MAIVDCAATPGGLVADLLFGAPAEHGRPRFRPGVLELVDGGSVILEEVCHLPEAAKARLLNSASRRCAGGGAGRHAPGSSAPAMWTWMS